MGSGLSMSSVNKIKELASAREYGLALELVESQDLSKSLNPQFLRLCGDIYSYNDKFVDARRVLLMAHRIAPQAKRIMYSLMELYLKMGYKELAKTYYDMYLVDADEEAEETKQLRYVYGKANGASPEELVEYLGTTYNENIDYEWSYETFLVYTMLDRQQETLSLALEYTAHYTNAPHCYVVADVLEGNIEAKDVFYQEVPECEDDDPAQEECREEERKLLEAYNLRMNPPEPEIISMVDDREEAIEFASKRKRKKFLKEQAKDNNLDDDSIDDSEDEELETREEESDNAEDIETAASEEDVDSKEELSDDSDKKQGLFKRAFSKLRLKGQSKDIDEEGTDEDASDEENSDEESTEVTSAESTFEDTISASKDDSDLDDSESVDDTAEKDIEEEISDDVNDDKIDVEEEQESVFEELDDTFDEPEDDDLSDIEALLASRKSKHGSAVMDDFDGDGFEAEMDSADEYDSETDKVDKTEESQEEATRRNSSIVFEDADFADEDEDDIPVDDFSDNEDDEFGKMRTVDEEDYDSVFVGEVEVEETKSAEEIYNDVESTFEDAEDDFEEATEEVEESEETYEAPEEVAEEIEDPEETYAAPEEVAEEIEEVEEPEETYAAPEEVAEEIEEIEEPEETYAAPEEVAEEIEEVEESEETYEAPEEVAEEIEEVEEPEETYEAPEEVAEEIEEVEESEETYEVSEEVAEEIEEVEEPEETYETPETAAEEVEDIDEFVGTKTSFYTKTEDEPWKNVSKSSLDFPVFRSSLFPEYHHTDTTSASTSSTVGAYNVNSDIQEKEQKLQENLRREEEIQREAEALLASLGIDISGGSAKTTPAPEKSISTKEPEEKYEDAFQASKKEASFIKREPSRDELKASLKIDSVKRNLLSKLKENR